MMRGQLAEYNKKRDFSVTGEPKGKRGRRRKSGLEFVVQKHGARRLHYDFRLELEGAMKSWAVTRGPSFDPSDRRLAVRTEDHPMTYNEFEGVIPEKQYGAGPVMIWDAGEWVPEGDPAQGLKKGHLVFDLYGERMNGRWHLVRMKPRNGESRENWLLIKGDDGYALKGKAAGDCLDKESTSIVSGRTLDEIRKDDGAGAQPERKKAAAEKAHKGKTTRAAAKKYASPALATLVEFPPSGKDWAHEIKYDGYRVMAFLEGGDVVLRTRGGHDWTEKFPDAAAELSELEVDDAVLDGELCVLDDKGVTSFSALQQALSTGEGRIEGWFFDLLRLDGKDLSRQPLLDRKKALKKILPEGDFVHYSEHFESSPRLLDKACKMGAEGIVSKKKDSAYSFRRSRNWLKSKCGLEQEFVIGGYMAAKNNPRAVGSLLLGYYKNGKFMYAGKVGTGFTEAEAKRLHKELAPLRAKDSPFEGKVEKGRRDYHWVRPKTLCEVSFWEWTSDQHIRHASFKGLRKDKPPAEVRRERPEKPGGDGKTPKDRHVVEGVTITHPGREVYPGTGITKGDIADYYARAMDCILPFVEGRFLSLLRCTETVEGECFYQRAPMKGLGPEVMGKTVTHKGKKHNFLYVDSPRGLLQLVQMGVIEFHAWQGRVDNLAKPDQMIFDLDPAQDVPFAAVRLAAQDVRQRLSEMGLDSFPRLTGGKGVHVAVPLKPQQGWEAVKAFARSFALRMEKDAPQAYVATMSKKKRAGKIFIDYLRNGYSATAIAPFSLRARKGAPVAVPVTWKELENLKSAGAFSLKDAAKKMNAATKKQIDEFFSNPQKLPSLH